MQSLIAAVLIGGALAGSPTSAAEEALGDALRNAIHDAVAGAVAGAHGKQPAVRPSGDPPSAVPDGTAARRPLLLFASRRSRLRIPPGHPPNTGLDGTWDDPYSTYANRGVRSPYWTEKPLNVMDEMFPVAPMDRLAPGIAAQTGWPLPPSYRNPVHYHPKREEIYNDFPQPYPSPDIKWSPLSHPQEPVRLRMNRLRCSSQPLGWTDKRGYNCDYYAEAGWCKTNGRPGPGWKEIWGTFSDYAASQVAAPQACCQCGGGQRQIDISGPEAALRNREVVAPEDAIFPDSGNIAHEPKNALQAPEDEIPLPVPPVAPGDTIPNKFARYLVEVAEREDVPDPAGLSVRYYLSQPDECRADAPTAAAIDRTLDYGSDVGVSIRPLQWPVPTGDAVRPVGGNVWFATWSGTVRILKEGMYALNLNVGFVTESNLRIDGQHILSVGQCAAATTEADCLVQGNGQNGQVPCVWNAKAGQCKPPDGAPLAMSLTAGGHCVEATVMVTPGARDLQLRYRGPDTDEKEIVVPGQMLFCDPRIKACKAPALQACKHVQPSCAGSPSGTFPGGVDPGFAFMVNGAGKPGHI